MLEIILYRHRVCIKLLFDTSGSIEKEANICTQGVCWIFGGKTNKNIDPILYYIMPSQRVFQMPTCARYACVWSAGVYKLQIALCNAYGFIQYLLMCVCVCSMPLDDENKRARAVQKTNK